jgi:serine/threonine protein kinase
MDLPGQLQSALASAYRIERQLGRGGMATVYLAHAKQYQQALRYFDGFDIGSYNMAVVRPLVELYRGQASEGLGDLVAAREHYTQTVRWLRECDPELVAVREQGRAALARLTAEPTGTPGSQ